jgi:hypothetical protein
MNLQDEYEHKIGHKINFKIKIVELSNKILRSSYSC